MVPSINSRWGGGSKEDGEVVGPLRGGGVLFSMRCQGSCKKGVFLMALRGRGIRTCHKIGLGSDYFKLEGEYPVYGMVFLVSCLRYRILSTISMRGYSQYPIYRMVFLVSKYPAKASFFHMLPKGSRKKSLRDDILVSCLRDCILITYLRDGILSVLSI